MQLNALQDDHDFIEFKLIIPYNENDRFISY